MGRHGPIMRLSRKQNPRLQLPVSHDRFSEPFIGCTVAWGDLPFSFLLHAGQDRPLTCLRPRRREDFRVVWERKREEKKASHGEK